MINEDEEGAVMKQRGGGKLDPCCIFESLLLLLLLLLLLFLSSCLTGMYSLICITENLEENNTVLLCVKWAIAIVVILFDEFSAKSSKTATETYLINIYIPNFFFQIGLL